MGDRIIPLGVREDSGSHVLVLDALVGEERRGEREHRRIRVEPLPVQFGETVAAFPERFQFGEAFPFQYGMQFQRPVKKYRDCKLPGSVLCNVHFFGG